MSILYVFLDEGGNLDFSYNGTKYFTLTALSKERPFEAYKLLTELKYDLIESGVEIEYFHATEDRYNVRTAVFDIISRHLDHTKISSFIIDKTVLPDHYRIGDVFYPEMLTRLLIKVLEAYDLSAFKSIIVFTDSIPVNRKRHTIEKSIKRILHERLPKGVTFGIFHHSSKSNLDLQIVDYCNWAIYRKMQTGDDRAYGAIKRVIENELHL